MRVFEKVQGRKRSYWRIERKGASFFTQRFVDPKKPGRVGVKSYATEAAAARAADKAIAKRLAAGWREIAEQDVKRGVRRLEPRECEDVLADALRARGVDKASPDLQAVFDAWRHFCRLRVTCRQDTFALRCDVVRDGERREMSDERPGVRRISVCLLRRYVLFGGGVEETVCEIIVQSHDDIDVARCEVDVEEFRLDEFMRGVESTELCAKRDQLTTIGLEVYQNVLD